MFELTLAALMMVTAHVAAVYVGTDILRLNYVSLLGFNVALGIANSILIQVTLPEWKSAAETATNNDKLGMAVMFMVGSSASGTLLYRRFGIAGWLGMVGASALVNYLV